MPLVNKLMNNISGKRNYSPYKQVIQQKTQKNTEEIIIQKRNYSPYKPYIKKITQTIIKTENIETNEDEYVNKNNGKNYNNDDEEECVKDNKNNNGNVNDDNNKDNNENDYYPPLQISESEYYKRRNELNGNSPFKQPIIITESNQKKMLNSNIPNKPEQPIIIIDSNQKKMLNSNIPNKPEQSKNAMDEYIFNIIKNPTHTFADIGGYKNLKEELLQTIDTLVKADYYKKFGIRQVKGFLLYVQPGNGKTLIVLPKGGLT